MTSSNRLATCLWLDDEYFYSVSAPRSKNHKINYDIEFKPKDDK